MAAPARLRVGIELGARRVFASALDFPGWARSGRTQDAALAALVEYAPRYALIAARAGIALPAAEARRLQALVDACWAAFAEVSSAAPEQLRRGPRGGGRDTSAVIEHVEGADAMALARKASGERYRARRRAWHLTDHLWEIQDRSV